MTCSNPTSSINVTTNDHNTPCSNNKPLDKMYKGVRKRKWGKWVSEIRLPNSRERIWLGSYDTQEKAARAFDAALYCLRGPHASFNFPNTPLTINLVFHHSVSHNSLSPQEIQEIAAKFANELPIELTQEEDQQVPSESQNDANSNSYSYPLDNDIGDLRRMDWRFEDMFDDMNRVANCSNFYGLQNMQYSTQLFEEDNVDQIECEDTFSNHSILWNWNF
ncbi:ethylene-responsive transcription factor ERF018 [Medicago truncatula]|uniref:Ethylene-responsive transcription factor ERF018 n=2 Tax=Medicago truncatula TaxID=3880 RepID=A0A072VEA7_MEDTR|nr:ethylene-responsive transcription factor ERF018 [Medicago truncatula]KEH39896.1 ethylene-responsive transcription factor ERF018 [Medicago truncatula]